MVSRGPTHLSKRVGDGVPGIVVSPRFSVLHFMGWCFNKGCIAFSAPFSLVLICPENAKVKKQGIVVAVRSCANGSLRAGSRLGHAYVRVLVE